MTHATFGAALEALKLGQKATRASWGCEDIFLTLEEGHILVHSPEKIIELWTIAPIDVLAEDWLIL